MKNGKQAIQTVQHTIAPVFNEKSRVLILGSMPSPVSRQKAFYYANPQNRFWRVMQAVFETEILQDTAARKDFLLKNKIAVWDVIAQCEISGADDASIKCVTANDLSVITDAAKIEKIFCTGGAAYKYYQKLCREKTGMEAVCLPSTSAANARYSLQMLVDEYKAIKECLRLADK